MRSFSADVDRWVLKSQRRLTAVVRQATNDAVVMSSRTRAGTSRGGSVTPGFVPRAGGALAASLMSSLRGSTILGGGSLGGVGYQMTVASMDAGDVATFVWTAPYAQIQHERGWLWVEAMAQQWPAIVASAVARAKAMG